MADNEAKFQQWYRSSAAKLGLNPNPDDPEHHYDYRAFYREVQAGREKTPGKGEHFPSAFKTAGHPREFLQDAQGRRFNTTTGKYDDGSEVQPMVLAQATNAPDPQPGSRIQATPAQADELDSYFEGDKPSKQELAAVKVAQGATGGFADEIGGVVNAARTTKAGRWLADKLLGVPQWVPPVGGETTGPTLTGLITGKKPHGIVDAYRAGRDAIRDREKEIEDAYPIASRVIEGGTALATGIATGALAGPSRLAQVGLAAGEGVLAGVGSSEGDLTRGEVGQVAKDAAISGGVSVALPLATAGVKVVKDARKVSRAVQAAGESKEAFKKRALLEAAKKDAAEASDDVRQRILNEVAEGDRGFKTTPTQQKHLDRAGDAIRDEVTTGPDAKLVRKALGAEAKPGRALLKPVIRKVNDEKEAAYETFAQYGRNVVDADAYKKELQRRAQDAIDAGDLTGADDLRAIADDFGRLIGDRTKPLDLKSLRKWTTGLQNTAAGAVGALNLHKSAGQKAVMSAHATEIMDDVLTEAAKGEKVLEQAAATIRKKNKRLSGLLTADKALELRQYKEAAGESLGAQALRGAAHGATGAIGVGGATYAITDDPEKALKAAAAGAVAGATPKLAQIGLRKLRHGSTSRAIKRGLQDEAQLATGKIPNRNKVGQAGRLAGKVAAPYVVDQPSEDDELAAYFE